MGGEISRLNVTAGTMQIDVDWTEIASRLSDVREWKITVTRKEDARVTFEEVFPENIKKCCVRRQQPDTTYVVNIRCYAFGRKEIISAKIHDTFELTTPEARVVTMAETENPAKMPDAWNTSMKVLNSVTGTINVLLVGGKGAGKTSFVNILATAKQTKVFDNRATNVIAPNDAHESDDHVTTECALRLVFQGNSGKINIFDCWGSTNDFDFGKFNLILDGKFSSGTKKDVPLGDDTTAKNPIDAVIFFLAAPDFTGKLSSTQLRMLNAIRSKGINPIVVLTKVDRIDKTLIKPHGDPLTSQKVQNIMLTLSTSENGVNAGVIFPLRQYYEDHDRQVRIELTALLAIRAAIKM